MGLATIRTITPLAKTENVTFVRILLVTMTVCGYVIILSEFLTLK